MSKLKNSGQNPCKCRARANKLNLIQRLVLSVTQLQCAAAAALLKPALVTMKKLNFKFESLISQDVQNQFWYKCLMGYKVKWRFKTLSFCKTLLNNVVGSMWRYAMQWTEFLWNFDDFLPTCFIWTVLFIFPCLVWGWGLCMIWGNYEISLKYETLTTEVMILRCKNPGRWYRVRNNFLCSLCFVFCARFEINSGAGVIWGTGVLLNADTLRWAGTV